VTRGETVYSAFISYRVFSEKYHALSLYEALNNTTTPGGHRVIVYLDVKRLVYIYIYIGVYTYAGI
jgi:hypothetical protein